jgi:hypothetical protein
MSNLPAQIDPSLPGPYFFDTVIYGSTGNNYASVPALVQYKIYDTPDPRYITPRLNLAVFANLGGGASWPFPNTSVPLNGHLCIPRGRGPFPLVLFAHGNHSPLENSTPGYLYLCQMLASQGFVAGTIDVNFLNGGNFGENDARGIVHLEHLKQCRTWHHTASHPLHGKLDFNRLMIAGHSRGGEGVGHASFFNRLASIQPDALSPVVALDGSAGFGPYRFNLGAVLAIAPTDGQYSPLTGRTVVPDSYFLIHGSRDGDVSNFGGYNTYNRAQAVDQVNPTVSNGERKNLWWVYMANHNQFNSIWASETPPNTTLPRASQELVAKVYVAAIAQALLQDRDQPLELLRDHTLASGFLPPGLDLVSQYQDPQRQYIAHQQEGVAPPQVSLPLQGTAASDAVVSTRVLTDLVGAGGPQSTITLKVDWTALGGRLLLRFDPVTLHARRYKVLALRVGQSNGANNVAGRDQDFSLEISTGARSFNLPASRLRRLLYPDSVGPNKIVMQTLRLPLAEPLAAGLDLDDLRAVSLVFDRRASGTLYIGDLQVSN